MEQAGKIINLNSKTGLPQLPTTPEQRIFNEQERDSIAYFFMRLQNIYQAEYRRQLPSEELEKLSKREWGGDIGRYTREQIAKGCDWIREQKKNFVNGWEFLDIGRCVGAIREANRTRALHREFVPALPDLEAKEKGRKAGKAELDKLKEIL